MSNNAKTVLVVPATADVAGVGADGTATWMASGLPGSDFEGLYALGESFADARAQLAATVWLAVTHGALDLEAPVADVAAVRILATTRKTFDVTTFTP